MEKYPETLEEMKAWMVEAQKRLKGERPPSVTLEEANRALSRTANITTKYTIKPRNEENWKRNELVLQAGRGIGDYADLFYGRPGFVVAAGPSLDKNWEQLRRVEGRWPMLCVDAAFPILRHRGITPDFTMVVDTKNIQAKFFRDIDPGRTVLLCISCAHPDVIDAWKGEIRFFNTWADEEDTKIQLKYGKDFGSVDVGGNVSTTLLGFVKAFLCCNPVIFVGHDFSYPYDSFHEKYYAEGGVHALRPVTKKRLGMHTYDGGWVQTDFSLWNYKDWTERWIRSIKEQIEKAKAKSDRPVVDHRFINATEGGILGTSENMNQDDILEFKTLEETIDELEEGERNWQEESL